MKAKLKEVDDLKSNLDFPKLSQDRRNFIAVQLAQLGAYEKYETFVKSIADPRNIRRRSKLKEAQEASPTRPS